MMEIVASLPTSMNGASGGTKKHVEEWSRLDRLTGMLEHARVEADHWASTTSNSRHHFGKVVDSRARNLADGSVQQKQQTKQLEVFQAHIPGGSVQVIRSHTSTTSSWHNSKVLQSHSSGWLPNSGTNLLNHPINKMEAQIDDLKLSHNSMNLNPEKDKVNVARHLSNRRPPTRSRISKRNHDDDNIFTDNPSITYDIEGETKNEINIPISKVENNFETNGSARNNVIDEVAELSDHERLEKKKSISDENLSASLYSEAGKINEKENSDPWKRSKVRRSFQHPSRCKKKDENSAEKICGNKSELEHVLEKVLRRKGDFEPHVKPSPVTEPQKPVPSWRRKSFVTEETLKETKQKLRHLSIDNCYVKNDKEEIDDGICTESKGNSDKEDEKSDINPEFINSTVTENQLTGSLESRNINKSDDWLDRRKSYGFEPVHAQQRNIAASSNSTPKTNLSTDSGICRSSELELVSTPIVKKVTEASEDRARTVIEEINKFREPMVKNDVSELLQKFEKPDKPRTGLTVVTLKEEPKIKILDSFDSQKESIKKGKVLEAIRSFEKNTPNSDPFECSPLIKANSYFLEQIAEKPTTALLNTEQDVLSKRHSIACDDTAYMASKFTLPEPTFAEKIISPAKTTVVNVNNFDSDDIPLPIADGDAKKPKKVEFSKTEVHFAAAEPGKIKIVETDEKPPPANLYRRKKQRSVSASPKVNLPQTKFGDYEKSLLNDKSLEKNKDCRNVEYAKVNGDNLRDYNSQYTSSTSDNGLAVTISSMKPTDYRRASWSVVENSLFPQVENKTGYSTKINFDGGGATIVAGVKSQPYEKARKSFTDLSEIKDRSCNFDASHDGENIQEKLIVRIGNSGGGCGTTEKYVQKPTFTNSFRNSINSSKTNGFAKLSKKSDDNLKSTSLIIDTIKKSMNSKSTKNNRDDSMEKKIISLKNERVMSAVEQPSTYITEMNKLQQKYRVKETRFGDATQNDKIKSRIYNTIPTTKNGFSRAKLLNNDLPSVLSAFDKLCRKIDKVMDENANEKSQHIQRNVKISETLSIDSKSIEKHSSQSRFLYDIAGRDDGNVSDDSLKADEEVRSYMSTAIMEEYENELCGSWSRKRYFKHIKPVKVVKQDEIVDKSHFKPLKTNDDKVKIIANVIDVKKPTITSMPLKLNENSNHIKNSPQGPKKTTTVLLNECAKPANFPSEMITKKSDNQSNAEYNSYKTQKNSPLKICNLLNEIKTDGELKHSNNSSKINTEEMFKIESEPVKVIYHDIKMVDKSSQNKTERGFHSPKKESDKDVPKHSKKINTRESVNNSDTNIKKRTNPLYSRDKLFDSGRDGWLNLPKERKSTSEKKIVENGKFKDVSRISLVGKDRRTESGINCCGDISSEEDLTKRNKKSYKPLTTIDEKSNALKMQPKTEKAGTVIVRSKVPATRTTSNSSIESRSNSFEFRNPVLKTEERSKRRAARMLQNTSSRQMFPNWNGASSSDDVTSENELHYSRMNKSRNIHKVKSSPKSSKPATNVNMPNSSRIVTQHSAAKMQINIFNMKEKPNEAKKDNRSYYTSSTVLSKNKTPSSTGQREISANSSQKSRTSKSTSSNNRETKKLLNTTAKSSRPVR